jgi:hypothetical protein
METPSGKKGKPSIRASLLPPDFQSLDPNGFLMTVPRLETAVVDHQQALGCHEKGLMACSFAGRGGKLTSIQPPWTKYEVYAANVQIEIDLEPELDEILGITTAKEQIVIVEEAWERLRQSGKSSDDLYQLIRACDTDQELFAKQSGAASTAH